MHIFLNFQKSVNQSRPSAQPHPNFASLFKTKL